MTKEQAIHSASYILGENVKGEFEKKEERAKSNSDYFFYVYNSNGECVKVSVNVNSKAEVYRVDIEDK